MDEAKKEQSVQWRCDTSGIKLAEYEDVNPLSNWYKGPNCGKPKEDEKNEPIYHVELTWDACIEDDGAYFKVRKGNLAVTRAVNLSGLVILGLLVFFN